MPASLAEMKGCDSTQQLASPQMTFELPPPAVSGGSDHHHHYHQHAGPDAPTMVSLLGFQSGKQTPKLSPKAAPGALDTTATSPTGTSSFQAAAPLSSSAPAPKTGFSM